MRWDAARAHEALDDQLELIRFWRTRPGVIFGDAFRDDERRKYGMLKNFPDGQMARQGADTLDRAETLWVSPDMHELVLGVSASPGLPTLLEEHDLPFRTGFAVFPEALFMEDTHGQVVSVGAMAWDVTTIVWANDDGKEEPKTGLMIWSYSTPRDPRDESAEAIRQRSAEVGAKVEKFLLLNIMGTALGEEIALDPIPTDRHNPGRYFLALMLLANQKIAGLSGVRPYRGLAKRAIQGRLRADVPEIQVIDLRRAAMPSTHEDEESDEAPLWSHRWVVDGFWRRQWYPSEGLHRWIYIAPYVKGPAHLPLIVKDRVFRLVR